MRLFLHDKTTPMEKIIMKRGYGKTTQLIKLSANTGDHIVCKTQMEADYIWRLANNMGLDIPVPITYSEFIGGKYQSENITGFLIDNIDLLVQHMTSIPVNAVTMTP